MLEGEKSGYVATQLYMLVTARKEVDARLRSDCVAA